MKNIPAFPKLKLAVIGHVEWVTFLAVDRLPKPGVISHAKKSLEAPAGGGAVAAIKLAKVTKQKVDFFTSLGRDSIGEKSYDILRKYNLNLYVSWKDKTTRRGISINDKNAERAITIIGERLEPTIKENLPWEKLEKYDAIFITATDVETLQESRKARKLIATPRLGIETLNKAKIKLDALIGSGLDPDEKSIGADLIIKPILRIETAGDSGGESWPGGHYSPIRLIEDVKDTYGCGDSFAAGVTAGLAAGFNQNQSIFIGSCLGAECATFFGPYE